MVVWAYIIAVGIVAFIVGVMIYQSRDFINSLNRAAWHAPLALEFVLWIALLILAVYIGYRGYFSAPNYYTRNMHNLILALILIVLLIWVFVYVKQKNLTNAFIMGIIFALLLVWWIFMWSSIDRVISYLLIIPLIWAIIEIAIIWDLRQRHLEFQ